MDSLLFLIFLDLGRDYGAPEIVNDGVTIARDINLPDLQVVQRSGTPAINFSLGRTAVSAQVHCF